MADLPDIPDEAVTEVARALHTRDKESGMHDPILGWYEELPEVQADYRDEARALLAAALPVLNTAKDAETARVDELDRWLNAGDVAGYASVEDLLNAMRVRRNWLAQGVPAVGPREIRVAIAAELETIAADDTGWAIGGYLRKRAASLRGEQGPLFTCPGLAMPQPTGAPPEGYVACYRAGHECTSKTTSTDDEHGGLSTRTFCPCCGDGHGYSYIPAPLGGGQR